LPSEEDALDQGLPFYKFESRWVAQFVQGVIDKKIKCLVIDEAQRDKCLVECLAKRADIIGHFLFSGTPPCGEECLDFNSSVYSRCAKYTLTHFDPYETLALLKSILHQENITSQAWLQFWTIFAGEPYFYLKLSEDPAADKFDVKRMANEGIYCESLHDACIKIIKESKDTGINQTLRDKISENNRMTLGSKSKKKWNETSLQKSIRQLLERQILEEVATLSEFISSQGSGDSVATSVLSWKDSLFSSDILSKGIKTYSSFRLRAGLALEDMLKRLILHAAKHGELSSIIGYQVQNLSMCTLSYENHTDADILLVEDNDNANDNMCRDDSKSEIQDLNLTKPKAFIFNVKTHATLFLGESGKKSQQRFGALCEKFASYFDVHLCLACVKVESEESRESILKFWRIYDHSNEGKVDRPYKINTHVMTLEEFLLKAPEIPVHNNEDGGKHFIDRSMESFEIASMAERNPSMLLQGRHRVGKTSLLKNLANSRDDWQYVELKEEKTDSGL
jgi:hypothetical protein